MLKSVKSTLILYNFYVCKWKNACLKDFIVFRILMTFYVYMYAAVCEEKERGILMHVYVWE